MMARMQILADKVTNYLRNSSSPIVQQPWTEPVKEKTPEPSKEQSTFVPYKVKVTAGSLNYRTGPGVSYKVNGTIIDKGIYTIIDEQNG